MTGGGVGEMIASAVVQHVAGKLGTAIWSRIGSLWNMMGQIDMMEETLLSLQTVLKDAEMRALKKESESERLWLQKVKYVAYDIEDALDDFEANLPEKMDRHLEDISRKVMTFFSSSNQLLMHIIKAQKMKSIRERLDKIEKQKQIFNFKVDGNSSRELEISEIRKRETFSKIEENHEIVGRNHEKENVIQLMLENYPAVETSILPIFGLGGLGKTTLAQLVFNDERVRNAFDLQAWVYVSIEFDLFKIGKSIISQFDGRTQNYDSLQDISHCLSRLLENKRCLIILDDLWEEDIYQLERLKLMLKGGASGTTIIVTTRSQKVSGLMATENIKPHDLKAISDEDCWFIFSQRAFKCGGSSTLVDVGKEIAKKCKGIPLAAKALGYIMQSKEGIDAWSAVRDSDIWQLEEDNILPSLKLSYYCMPPSLKLCFIYCAIFPKGCELVKHELIQQWIALGLFSQPNPHFTIEEKGEEHVESLLSMSFLEYSSKHSKRQKVLHMHDLVHDLVRAVAGEEVFFQTKREDDNSIENHECRYALLKNCNEPTLVKKALWNKVRALNFKHCSFAVLPRDMFVQKRFLRILDLSGCCVEELPDSIGMLKQMRYLDVSKNPIQLLPKSISNLQNMSALSLSKTHLNIIPSYVCKLQNLRYLNLHGCYNLQLLPESISDLVSLVDLNLSDCCNLQVLPESFGKMCKLKMLDLSGCSELPKLPEFSDELDLSFLDLSGCSSLENLPESFGNLSKLRCLYLSGCSRILMFPNSINSLANLEILDVSYCSGITKLPNNSDTSWNLQKLDLTGCSNLITIPSGIENIRYFENPYGSVPKIEPGLVECKENIVGGLQSNTIVQLEHQNEIKEIVITHIENVNSPNQAERAKLCNKSKLHSLTLEWSAHTERLINNNKPLDECVLEKLQPHRNLECLKIYGYSNIQFPGWVTNMEIFIPKLVKIEICDLTQCDQLPPLGQLSNLEVLKISNAPKIKEIEIIACGERQSFAKLRELYLSDLEKLEKLSSCMCMNQRNLPQCSEGPALLENLQIHNCPNMRSLPWNLLSLFSLKELAISNSSNELMELYIEWDKIKLTRRLIHNCPMIHIKGAKEFNYQVKKHDPTIIEKLVIELVDDFDVLRSSVQELISLRSIEIRNCPQLERVPEWIGYIATLEELIITGCNSLESMPRSMLRLTNSGEFTVICFDGGKGRVYLRQRWWRNHQRNVQRNQRRNQRWNH